MFRWKPFQKVLINNQILFKWKLRPDPLCNICNEIDNYDHFFTKCKYFENLRLKMHEIFTKIGYAKNMLQLENFVFGYKISENAYDNTNIFFTFMGYEIYKCYCMSEQRIKAIDLLNICKTDLNLLLNLYTARKFRVPKIFHTAKEVFGIQ